MDGSSWTSILQVACGDLGSCRGQGLGPVVVTVHECAHAMPARKQQVDAGSPGPSGRPGDQEEPVVVPCHRLVTSQHAQARQRAGDLIRHATLSPPVLSATPDPRRAASTCVAPVCLYPDPAARIPIALVACQGGGAPRLGLGVPDSIRRTADLESAGSLTPGLNWSRANVLPESGVELPPVQHAHPQQPLTTSYLDSTGKGNPAHQGGLRGSLGVRVPDPGHDLRMACMPCSLGRGWREYVFRIFRRGVGWRRARS